VVGLARPADPVAFVVCTLSEGLPAAIAQLRAHWQPPPPAAAVSRPFPSSNRSMLAEIYLCHACSCHEILRAGTAGQAAAPTLGGDAPVLPLLDPVVALAKAGAAAWLREAAAADATNHGGPAAAVPLPLSTDTLN
jgi:hypothetical protein